jgi:hypothetical protein
MKYFIVRVLCSGTCNSHLCEEGGGTNLSMFEISGSHSSEDVGVGLLDCNTIWT